jgi:hypothetical protein
MLQHNMTDQEFRMAKYEISLIQRPPGWQPAGPDDVPAEPGRPLEVLGQADNVFAAVRQAIEYNQAADRQQSERWAVVVEPGVFGRYWRHARLCTPLVYKVAAIWWPAGWEPQSPIDVPNCVWRAQGEMDQDRLTYPQALATVRGLNQQSMNHAAAMWYVIIAMENESISQTVSLDPAGTETTVQVRRLHVVRPESGGKGDCSYCPAHSFQCAKEDWFSAEQTIATTETRGS